MKHGRIVLLAGLIIGSVFLLSLAWEFVLEGLVAWFFDAEYKAETKSERWEFAISAAIFAGLALVVPYLLMLKTTAQRERAVEALSKSEGRLAQAQRIAQVGDWEWNIEANVLHWSAEVYRIFGSEPHGAPVTVETVYASVHPDDKTLLRQAVKKALDEKKPYSIDYRIVLLEGDGRVVHEQSEVICDPSGKPIRIRGTVQDITKRKRAEQKLQRSEASLADAQRMAHLGSWDMDVGTGDEAWSDEHYRILGLEPGECEACHEEVIARVHPDDLEQFKARVRESLYEGKPYDSIFRIVRPDGTVRTIQSRGEVTCDPSGKPIRMSGTMQDITVAKEAEEALQAAKEKAEAANVAKSEFLATMSHEIRTPMNGVIGMTGLLLDSGLNDEQRDYAETVRQSGDALLALINDILDLSKLEFGKLDLENIDFDVVETIESVTELLGTRAHAKGIDIGSFITPDVPAKLRGDPGRLRQILLNLAGNAIKFTETGSVSIEVSVAPSDGENTALRFEVMDTGIGIPLGVQQKLFEKFTQADASTTRKFGGSGLGLAISKQLVTMMGGEIGVSSAPGAGSIFWFTALFGQAEADTATQSATPNLGKLRVLVVDDSELNRRILRNQLEAWGMTVMTVADAFAAMTIIDEAHNNRTPFDVALIDYMMPRTDGMTLARSIRENPAFDGTKLVLVASSMPFSDIAAARVAGFARRLTKPIRQSTLFDCLADLFGAASAGPRQPPTPEEEVAVRADPPHRRLRVLVAEDNHVNQRVVAALLSKAGHRADIVGNGLEAIEAVCRVPYDLVLMDVQMPEMDGVEATRKIRALSGPVADIPIVAMTANAMSGDREKYLAAGMSDYVAKPIDLEQLSAAIMGCVSVESVDANADGKIGAGVLDIDALGPSS